MILEKDSLPVTQPLAVLPRWEEAMVYSRESCSRKGSSLAGRHARNAGLTLIELLVALTIMAALSAIAIPKINTTRFRMDQSVALVRGTLQMAERLSVTKQFDVVVSFDLARNMVRILEDADNDAVVDAGERIVWKALEDGARFQAPAQGVSGAASSAILGSNLQTVGGLPSIIFRRNGAASSNLEVYLTSAQNNPGDFRAVTVERAIARSAWFRHLNNQWKSGGL